MKFYSVWLYFLSLLCVALAADAAKRDEDTTSSSQTTTTTLSSQSDTTIWVTITTNGALATIQTVYSQSFMQVYSDATGSAPAGTIGLGSHSGDVGNIRTYSQTTIKNEGGRKGVYSGAMGGLFLILGSLL